VRYVGRANLAKRLAPLEGTAGRSTYAEGSARFALADATLTVTPPFGLADEAEYDRIVVAPLLDALAKNHVVAAVLVRLGGYAFGVLDGERLIASKVGSRFVKGRHRAGGSSANRFRRRREGQERELLAAAADEASRVLTPWRNQVEHVALGGDRTAVRRMLAERADLSWLEPLVLARFLTTDDPRRRVLEELPYQLYAAAMTEER